MRPSGYTDFGTVSLSTETVRVSSGEAKGSAPIQSAGFEFKGWYLDEACKQPVQESVYKNYLQPDGKTLKPQKNAAGVYDDALAVDGQIIFYALFEPPTVADLVITKSGADDKNQVFVYRVTGSYGMDMEVTIVGNGSVTIHALPRGSYIVTEDNGWSWRYENGQETEQGVPSHGSTGKQSEVKFATTTPNPYWLDGHSKLVRNKKRKTGGTP